MEGKEEKVDLGLDNYLKVVPNHFEKKYGIFLQFKNSQRKNTGSLTYEVNIRALKTEPGAWIYTIDKENLRINDQKPHETLDIIASKCNQVLYPLEIRISRDLSSKSVNNQEQIAERWDALNEALQNQYENELIEWYLDTTENKIKNSRKLLNAIDQDIFLASYFAPLHQVYGMLTNMVDITMDVPILPNTLPVSYAVEQTIGHFYTDYDTITVVQEGTICDQRSGYDLVTLKDIPVTQTVDDRDGYLNSTYQLERDSKIIQSIIVDCHIELPYNKGKGYRLEAFEIQKNKSKDG